MQQKYEKFIGNPCLRGHTLKYGLGTCVECLRLSQARNSEKRKQVNLKYNNSDKARVAKSKYRRTYKNLISQRKYDATPQGRLRRSLRDRVRRILQREKGVRPGSAVRDLGCSIEFFKQYITDQFIFGMSWKNHGHWHLDHIRPLASFDLTDRGQFLQAMHYTNYQPLWAEENRRKAARYA